MQRSRKKKSSDVDNSVKVVRPNSFESSGILDAPTDKSVKK